PFELINANIWALAALKASFLNDQRLRKPAANRSHIHTLSFKKFIILIAIVMQAKTIFSLLLVQVLALTAFAAPMPVAEAAPLPAAEAAPLPVADPIVALVEPRGRSRPHPVRPYRPPH